MHTAPTGSPRPLTPRQAEYLQAFLANPSATYRAIGKVLGGASKQAVYYTARHLQRQGFVHVVKSMSNRVERVEVTPLGLSCLAEVKS